MSATVTPTSSAVLPEPEEVSQAIAGVGNADDLIAQLADKQIDAMLSESDVAPPDPDAAVEAALQAASELGSIAADLSRSTASLVEAESKAQQVENAPAAFVKPIATPDLTIVIEPPTSAASAVVEPRAQPDAEPEPVSAAPSFDPPRPADIERGSIDEVAEAASPKAHAAASTAGHSSAAQVAAELAADVQFFPATPTSAPIEVALPSNAIWRRVLAEIFAIPMTLLAILNLPVRSLSDNGREAIGAIAVVTLANATALLLYLMIFS